VRFKCPICGCFAPEGETFSDAIDLALRAGFVIMSRIGDGLFPRYAVCKESCYQRVLDIL